MSSRCAVKSGALRRGPRRMNRFHTFDDAGMTRAPAEAVARLLRGHELVLVEPGADIVALRRSFAASLAGITGCGDASAHDVEDVRTQFVSDMKDLAGDGTVIGLGREPIGFGEIGNMDPRPATLQVAAEHDLVRF